MWGWLQTVAGRRANEALVPGVALILAPHPDDETVGCGLLIAAKVARGIPVAVAVATDGHAGWHAPTPRPAPEEITEIRHGEWHRSLDALGVSTELRFEFSLPDGALSDHEDRLAGRIGELLRQIRPAQVFVTRSGDPHPDHRALAQVVARVIDETYGLASGHVQAAGSRREARPDVFTYRVYPTEGLWSGGRPPRASTAVARAIRSTVGLPRRRAWLFRDAGGRSTKAEAVQAYASQNDQLSGELRFVWAARAELYWPAGGRAPFAGPGSRRSTP